MVTIGLSAFYAFFDRIMATFSEMRINVEDTIGEGEEICIRWTCTGKHTGDGLGVAPTSETIHITGISIMKVVGTKFVESWQNWDMLGMMQQIKSAGKSATYIGA
jgi:predicted ester cyclase